MHTVDIVVVGLAVVVVLLSVAVLARQRYLLKTAGGFPVAVQRDDRWLYGVARYVGSELRWYRSLGIGTRPSRVLARGDLRMLGRRSPEGVEQRSLPKRAVIVSLEDPRGAVVLAFGEGAYTGFVSWLEASAPRP